MTNRAVCLMVLLCFVFTTAFPAYSQDAAADTDRKPLPYKDDEFADWQRDLRRAEIIAFGSLPFVTLLSSLTYDIYRYYDHDQDARYKPWPFRDSAIAVPKTEDEQKRVLLVAVGISIGVAVFDYGFRAIRRSIRKSRLDKQNDANVRSIRILEIDGAEPAQGDGAGTSADTNPPAGDSPEEGGTN